MVVEIACTTRRDGRGGAVAIVTESYFLGSILGVPGKPPKSLFWPRSALVALADNPTFEL